MGISKHRGHFFLLLTLYFIGMESVDGTVDDGQLHHLHHILKPNATEIKSGMDAVNNETNFEKWFHLNVMQIIF